MVTAAGEEKENYDHNSAQLTEDLSSAGKQTKRSISRPKETEAPTPGMALKTLAPGATNEVLEKARVIVEKAVKQNKVMLESEGTYELISDCLCRCSSYLANTVV